MKYFRSIVGALLVIALSAASSARAEDEAALRACKRSDPHATVPRIDGLSYDQARKKILAAGWKPRVTAEQDDTLTYGNGPIFWSRGYREVEVCAGTGLGQCLFDFVDGRGNRLQIETAGEEDPEGSYHAIVDKTRLLCRQTGS